MIIKCRHQVVLKPFMLICKHASGNVIVLQVV